METQNFTAQCYNWLQCHVQGERMRHCETKYRKGVKQGWYSMAKKVSLLEFSSCFVYSPPAGVYTQKRQGVGMYCRWAYITVSFTYLGSILIDTWDSNLNRECTLRTSVLFMNLSNSNKSTDLSNVFYRKNRSAIYTYLSLICRKFYLIEMAI